jgi:hypothetical protein
MDSKPLKVHVSSVSLVLRKAVLGIQVVHFAHDPIASHFRNNTRRRDTETLCVALDYGGLGKRKRMHWETVDEDMVRLNLERSDRSPHSLVRCAQDVEKVDIGMLNYAYSPKNVSSIGEFAIDRFAMRFGERLRIAKRFVTETLGQNYRAGHHRPCERTASGLVDSSNDLDAALAQLSFVSEAATHVQSFRQNLQN